MANEIPNIVIGRLPIYLRELNRLAEEEGKLTTSSHELGYRLGISSAQIRKDLSHFGEFGKQGTGYDITFLTHQLREILHLNQGWPVVLVGAGHLGHALINYNGFQHRGFHIGWAFDNDPKKIGQVINGITVQPVQELEQAVREHHLEIAIIVVPGHVAQDITNTLVRAGIKTILSYAPIHLKVPDNIQVSYSDPVIELQRMTYYLNPLPK